VGPVGLGKEWNEMRSERKAGAVMRNLGFSPIIATAIGRFEQGHNILNSCIR